MDDTVRTRTIVSISDAKKKNLLTPPRPKPKNINLRSYNRHLLSQPQQSAKASLSSAVSHVVLKHRDNC